MDAPNQYNQNLQNPNDILSALSTLSTSLGSQPTPQVAIPALDFTAPTGGNISAKYQEFLNDAANDPNLVNYYNQLLGYAQGDTNVAIQQLKTDYTTGVRHTTENLKNSLAQLGLTFTGESNNLLDTLNKRGIALTQQGGSSSTAPLQYAGGGQSATELGQLNQSQQLRQEAQQRSAQQNIESAGLSLNKGITNANEALQNQAISLKQQKQTDITNRANMMFGNYQNQQYQDAQLALMKQQSGGGGGVIGEFTSPQFGDIASKIGAGKDLSSGTYGQYKVTDTGHGTRVVSYA